MACQTLFAIWVDSAGGLWVRLAGTRGMGMTICFPVVLSACETGLGKEKRGEGVMGLTRAFMYAGAPTVGVSLWSVADKSTADLMTDFYRRLLAGESSTSGALRAAQLSMIETKKYSAPFYWAPFVLVGDWK